MALSVWICWGATTSVRGCGCCRVDASRQIAARIADEAVAEVAVEDLKLSNMAASAKGTEQHPGRGVAAKRALNRKLNRAAIARLHTDIERACLTRGRLFTKVPARNTSRICHLCGTLGQRETQALFKCLTSTCGWVGNADHNAACNVQNQAWERRRGLRRRKTVRTRGTCPHNQRPSQTNPRADTPPVNSTI